MVTVLPGCVRHMITPAYSSEAYTRKAVATAEAALSSVNTVLLLSETGVDGKLFSAFANVSVSEQEDALDDTQSGFRSIQPPNAQADELREELDSVLTSALEITARVRIAMRRGDFEEANDRAQALRPIADALTAFVSSS